ncbi:MAG: PstA family ABC transporter permease [Phycisphaerales bacterium JB040]
MTPQPANKTHRHHRRTPPAARGETATWLTGGALVACVALILAIIALIAYHGGRTFWPHQVEAVTLESGQTFLGVPLDTETIDATGGSRTRYRVGNRDLGQESFEWVAHADITRTAPAEDSWYVEREDWGVFIGYPERILLEPTRAAEDRAVKTLAEGSESVREAFDRLHPKAVQRRDEIQHLNDVEAPGLQNRLNQIEWAKRKILLEQTRERTGTGLPGALWAGLLLLAGAGVWAGARLARLARQTSRADRRRRLRQLASIATMACSLGILLVATLEHPWVADTQSPARVQSRLDALDQNAERIRGELEGTLDRLRQLREEDSRVRIVIRDPRTDRFAPESRSATETPLRLSQVIRVVPGTGLSVGDRLGVYLSRWGEFLSQEPRADGAEGGVFPIIVGTVILTLLLNICVVPLGVIAALYLREYAHQGTFTSIIRIAINNLAGVPSIVYGMFGLGFFCYFLGGYIDQGPSAPLPRPSWWLGVGVTLLLVVLASGATMLATHPPGLPPSKGERLAKTASWLLWTGAVVGAGWMVFSSPYFSGFFAHKLPESSTMGARGILWAALTLALLTLPVVIVATEEAIAAVPNSMREGSLACGASKWQTIKRIVLPSSLPGVMTGAILAMARGAGEVAPLMLVGAVNFAPALPVSGEPPFLHGDRTFMHLGFHIYSLGFQSPDSEAAKPLVWTTTLLLILIVLILNLVAVFIRSRLRSQMSAASI